MEDRISLATLANGGAIEMVDDELSRVFDNIVDLNTAAKKAREVILKIKLTPDEDRELANVEISAVSKLAPVNPYPTKIEIFKDREGRGVGMEYNPKQIKTNETVEDGKIVKIGKIEGLGKAGE